jgi:endoglucanase
MLIHSKDDYIFSAWGKTIWGSDADKAALDADFANIRNNFTDIPLIIGEWAASPVMTETAARWKYFDYLVRTAAKYNTSTVLWDNGNDFLNRSSHAWRDQTAIDIYMNAFAGKTNSLPDSTEDASATSQYSSAYIFHKIGDAVTDISLPFQLNGNTVKSISVQGGTALTSSQYSVSGNNITFPASFLSKYVSATASEGIKATLTISFSAGASVQVQVVQWDVPTIATASSKAVAGADLFVPITYKGIHKPAAVRGVESDGTYLADTWTVYLGPLQQARITFGNQFNWDCKFSDIVNP